MAECNILEGDDERCARTGVSDNLAFGHRRQPCHETGLRDNNVPQPPTCEDQSRVQHKRRPYFSIASDLTMVIIVFR